MSIEDQKYSYFSAICDLVIMLKDVAHNSIVRTQWQYQVPSFMNRGRATTPSIVPLSTYLLNDDCISFIKRIWKNCESKDALNNNEHRDIILKEVFWSADEGLLAVEKISGTVLKTCHCKVHDYQVFENARDTKQKQICKGNCDPNYL